LLFGAKLRNKNAKWEIAEKTKKKNRQAQTFLSSLFTNSLPVDWTGPSNRTSTNFWPAACQLFLHSNDVFGATLHFGFGFRG
jgi:anaerobic ribonucleoside-triphosphate reductase